MSLCLQVMYENKARLICSAEGTLTDIFEKIVTISDAKDMENEMSDLCVDNELAFVKDRSISR